MHINLIGQTFQGQGTRFEVRSAGPKTARGQWWNCVCDCGIQQTQLESDLTTGFARCKFPKDCQRTLTLATAREERRTALAEEQRHRDEVSARAQAEFEDRRRRDQLSDGEKLHERYRQLCAWVVINRDDAAINSLKAQMPLDEWLRTNEENRRLITQLFRDRHMKAVSS